MNKRRQKSALSLIILTVFCMVLSACASLIPSRKITPAESVPESGIIGKDTVLGGEIIIDKDILVLPGVALKIVPGTRLLFVPTKKSQIEPRFLFTYPELLVQGKLLAEGTPDLPITFTSAAETPKMKDWAGIILDNLKEESVLKNCRIEYAQVGIYCIGTYPKIINNKLKYNETGIICQKEAQPEIKNNFIGSGKVGIACWDNSVPIITYNEITDQEQAGLLWADASPWFENNAVRFNKYGLFGDSPFEWANNQISDNEQNFYLSGQNNQSEQDE